ncbi:hypothetical protein ACWDV4_06540 [Micromonospora sp. NPDC003197]
MYAFQYSLSELSDFSKHEFEQHVEKSILEAETWADMISHLENAAKGLEDVIKFLKRCWWDLAFDEFKRRIDSDIGQIRKMIDEINGANLVAKFESLPGEIEKAHTTAGNLYIDYADRIFQAQTLGRQVSISELRQMELDAGMALDKLANKYLETKDAVLSVSEALKWVGPRADLAGIGPGGPGGMGGSGSAGLGGGLGSLGPGSVPNLDTTLKPSPTDTPANPTDPKELLEGVPEALNALSQAMQSLGAAGGMSNPVTLPVGEFDPSDLGSMSPDEYADYLERMGSPSLAGGGVDIGGGGAAGMTAVSPVANPVPLGGSTNAVLPSGALSSATGLTAGTGGYGGMPSMYPPQTQGSNPGSGVRPAATAPVAPGSPRKRKTSDTPGVSLVGRARRVGPTKDSLAPPPSLAPQQQRSTEQDNGQLLDEELWQVNQQARKPRTNRP